MALCGKRYREVEGGPERVCSLDAGHDEGCSGPIDRAVLGRARAAAKHQHAELEAEQRAATELAIGAKLELGESLSPAEFAAAILAIAGEKGASARAVMWEMKKKIGGELMVNGRPAGVKEIKQAAARLARDGLATLDGDLIRAA